jgi:hypothetical protein
MGDDEPHNSAEEGVPINILPRMLPRLPRLLLTMRLVLTLDPETYVYLLSVSSISRSTDSMTLTCTETKNTWHRPDPSFTYLLSFFLLLTSFAWGLAYAEGFGRTIRITLVFIFVHFLLISLLVSTAAYFLVGRLLGPGVPGLPGRRRQGLFIDPNEGEQLEFGYCFDVRGSSPDLAPMSGRRSMWRDGQLTAIPNRFRSAPFFRSGSSYTSYSSSSCPSLPATIGYRCSLGICCIS